MGHSGFADGRSLASPVGWDIADLRTDGVLQVRKAKHEVSRSETSANDNAERKANPRDLPNITKLAQTAALTLALSFFITAPAMAQAPVPTLDRLNQEGATIPDTNPLQVYPESAYTLTEIENADPENLPQNAITLYDKNDDGTVTPKYYTISLKQTEFFDIENYGEKLNFKLEKNDNKYFIVEANVADADITYYFLFFLLG